ncbi:toxin-antitoxin system YwqK family antitoxin [Flavobacterium gelidilacus]|uniref:toxin-antitoxin system YwqK family antitoxin n=1 Tax=Flavobacterium gelidilacus TaxID=206041 RepID=UPI0012FADC73|nr:toxin-antitoxin system YwqK family antitoxin [Flavobacterium gelidilacus]
MNYTLINIIFYFQETIKELQVVFNKLIGLGLFVLVFSCNSNQTDTSIEVKKDDLVVNPEKGLVYYKNEPFTGNSVQFYLNSVKAESIAYRNGIQNGLFQKWFDTGKISFEANYKNGLLDGKSYTWWKNNNKRSESNYANGISQGVQKQWYQSGAIFKEITLVNGKEEGLQKAYRENGKIYNNYEAKNGRIFGLKRASLCYELEEEVIQYKE